MKTETFTANVYRCASGELVAVFYEVTIPGWRLVATKDVEIEIPDVTPNQAAASLLEKAAAIEAKAAQDVSDLLAKAKRIMSDVGGGGGASEYNVNGDRR